MEYEEIGNILKVIGDENRLKMIFYLAQDSFCGCELVEFLGMSQPAVSQHLKKLREAGITREAKRGRWVHYSLNKQHELYPFILHLVSLLPPLERGKERIVCN